MPATPAVPCCACCADIVAQVPINMYHSASFLISPAIDLRDNTSTDAPSHATVADVTHKVQVVLPLSVEACGRELQLSC